MGVLWIPLKRPKKGLLGPLRTLWRDSGGVRKGSDRGLEEVGRVRRRKKRVEEVEREKMPDLESWREGFKG